MLSSWINQKFLNADKLKTKFKANLPFPNLALENFFNREKMIALLRALAKEQFHLKDSDLFTFFQTYDFRATKNRPVKEFRDFFASPEFIDYLSKISNTKLKNNPECFATIYQDTNYLLPHDDHVENRKIAYMVYLSNLSKKEGGTLNFYSSRKGLPLKIAKKIAVSFNTLVLFEVSKKSFHSVSEVTAKKQRLTVTGWFYD
ncbi:MAG TPA: 2OG-Fe(II) oxygenase family protein [Candidatus Nanoarchaeia archaeon]|nr:2OG-Fe(II) oxygenase family protein [Candidatus Nanoarchaeia archaeon]